MKHILSKAVILLLVLSTTGCSDFLQKDPPSDPSNDTFWETKDHFDYALNSCFSVAYDWPGVIAQIIPCLDNLTDNSYCQHNEGTYGGTQTMLLGNITPQSGGYPSSLYSLMYKGIGRVHQILGNLKEYKGVDMSADQRKFYEAQCHAMRGYFYYWLYLCFKEVPIVTDVLNENTMYQPPKAARSKVKEQIFADFDKAISLMGDGLYFASGSQGYWTKGALTGLKARIMMYDAYTNGVADAAQMGEVVTLLETIKGYSLSANWRSNFISMGQKDNKEIMFSVRYLNPNLKNSVDLYYGSWGTNQMTRDLVNEYEFTDGLEWGVSPLTPTVDETILSKKPEAVDKKTIDEFKKLYLNRDRRLHETINHSGAWGFQEAGFPDSVFTKPEGANNFLLRKMIAPFVKGSEPSSSTNSDPDIVILRYGHILLMIAEAENEANGATPKAYAAINEIRLRAGQPALPAGLSQDEFRRRVRKEWRVETVAEGLRYFQLKQWNLMEQIVPAHKNDPINKVSAVWLPAFMYWPLPQGEIDKAAGVLVQDPAYI